MDRSKVKFICELCAGGQFQTAVEHLKHVEALINDNIALKVIVNVCKACVSNVLDLQNISDLYLHDILIMCVLHIEQPNENQILSYSQAMFHIMKFLLEKESCDYIFKLENIWIPKFLKSDLPEKIIDNYEKIAKLIHNFIQRGAMKSKEINESSWLKLNCLFLKICSYLPQISFMQLSYGCLSSGKSLNIPAEVQEDFYSKLLQLIINQETQHSDTFEYVFRYTLIILSSTLSIHKFERTSVFYDKLTDLWNQFVRKEYTYLHRLLKLPLILSTLEYTNVQEEVSKCSESLILLESKLHSKVFQKVVISLNNLIDIVMKFYKKEKVVLWQSYSTDVKLEIYELFLQIACTENRISSEEIVFSTFMYADYITSSINSTMNTESDHLPVSFHKKSTEILKKFFDNISILKQLNSEKWKTAWEIVSIPIYNIGVNLFRRSISGASYYFILVIREYIKLDGHNSLKLKFSMLTSILNAIYTLNANDYKKKMAYSALSILLCPKDAEVFMVHFINIKYSKVEIGLQSLTLVSAFNIFRKELGELLGTTYMLNQDEKKRLLIFELRQYKRKWKSKLPMMHALKELYETADLKFVVDAVVEVFGDGELNVHENVPKIIYKIMNEYESTTEAVESIQHKLNLSILYMLHYKYRFKEVIIKNVSDMERSMSVNKKEELPGDFIEECDIVSSYESLTLKVHLNNMAYLDKSLSLLSSVEVENIDDVNSVCSKDVYKLLMKISYEYKLQMHNIRSLQALHLALKIAQKDKNSNDIVATLTLIIDYFDIRNPYIKYLTFLADKELENLDASNIEHLQTIIMFLTVKSKVFLYIDYRESLRIFNVANQMLEDDKRKEELKVIYSQVLLQNYRLVILPCNFNVRDHRRHTLLTIYMANSTIVDEYRNRKMESSYELSILLDTIHALIEYYDLRRCTRELRSHCKEAVLLTQKLVLPIWCAVFLKYLAHADVRTFRNDDGHVKLKDISSILCLNKNVLLASKISSNGNLEQKNSCDELGEEILAISHGDMKQMRSSSPSVYIRHTLPAFLKHDEECNCYGCICFEYQKLILEKMRLDALLNINQGYNDISRACFEGAITLLKGIQNRYNYYQETCNQFLPCGLIPECDDEFLSTYGFILLEYSRYLSNNNDGSLAKAYNNELINLLKDRKNKYIYLWNEALVQKLLYFEKFHDREINPVPEMDHMSLDDNQNENNIPKTPENRSNPVNLTITCSPLGTTSQRPVKKCIPFVISPDDHVDVKENVKTPTKINIFCDISKITPVSKIQIYSESTKKTNKKLKVNCPAIQVLECADEPSSSNPLVPVQSSLRVRTKLLTEKIKQNAKKSHQNSSENVPESGGVVRRSQRTKK